MKKFLRDNKGVIIFYAELVIITLIVVNNLQKGSDKMINNDDMIRISVGIEDIEDLKQDFTAAIQNTAG